MQSTVKSLATFVVGATLVLGGALAVGADQDRPQQIKAAIAWLQNHYKLEEGGNCPKLPCPLASKWILKALSSEEDRIDIIFVAPAPATAENIRNFRSAKDLGLRMEGTFCPYGGLEVYKIAKPPIEIWVQVLDPQYGRVASHKCSRRILY